MPAFGFRSIVPQYPPTMYMLPRESTFADSTCSQSEVVPQERASKNAPDDVIFWRKQSPNPSDVLFATPAPRLKSTVFLYFPNTYATPCLSTDMSSG